MDDPIINRNALRQPHNRQLLILIAVALLALLAILALWQTTGTRGAKHDLTSANDRVAAKQREVDDARRTLDQRIAELRAVRADADVQATKLGSAVDAQVDGAVNDPAGAPAAPVYYVRDRDGRFVPVARP